MNEIILNLVVQRLNQLCLENPETSFFLGVRRISGQNILFRTAFGEVQGFLKQEGSDLVIGLGNQILTIPLGDLLGKSN